MNAASAAATVVNAANKASTFASQTVETARTEVLKEPLGFIKIVQLVIAIITFAVAVNGGDTIKFTARCSNSTSVPETSQVLAATYSYPYDLAGTKWSPTKFCANIPETTSTICDSSTSIVASAGFFVFTGVMSFLYASVFIVVYVFFRHKYQNMVFFPIIDFILTCVFTLFWFIGSIAWSKAVDDLKDHTSSETLVRRFATCKQVSCRAQPPYPTYASVVISCIFGFGNVILWAGNCWFVLKETVWYKNRMAAQQQQQSQQQTTSASASYNPNNNKI